MKTIIQKFAKNEMSVSEADSLLNKLMTRSYQVQDRNYYKSRLNTTPVEQAQIEEWIQEHLTNSKVATVKHTPTKRKGKSIWIASLSSAAAACAAVLVVLVNTHVDINHQLPPTTSRSWQEKTTTQPTKPNSYEYYFKQGVEEYLHHEFANSAKLFELASKATQEESDQIRANWNTVVASLQAEDYPKAKMFFNEISHSPNYSNDQWIDFDYWALWTKVHIKNLLGQ